jgi:hypothetical protein
MLIDKIEKMETVVSSNKSLSWDGWDVLNTYASDKARTSKYGVYQNGKWYIQQRFSPDRNGWSIPDRFIKENAKA